MNNTETLHWAINRIAQMQNQRIDGLRLQAALSHLTQGEPPAMLANFCNRMGFAKPSWLTEPDEAKLPLLAHSPEHGWFIVIRKATSDLWLAANASHKFEVEASNLSKRCAVLNTQTVDVKFGASWMFGNNKLNPNSFMSSVFSVLKLFKPQILEACIASMFIASLALATSLFSMQVYDRVIPIRSEHTLIILASGVALVILVELAMKFARAKVMDYIIVGLDNRLSRDVFAKLMNLRVDQLPPSVGSLAGQVRGYEQVRSFYTASTLFTLIDLPMSILFVILIMFIGHPVVAAVPLAFGLIALYIGLSIRERITQQALNGAQFSNLKTGLLVESVEGIETIKAGSGGWKFLSRWLDINEKTIQNDLKTRRLTESVTYLAATMQQLSYAGVVVAGAWAVIQGHMTMGALIACSIMSGRVLAPILALPNLLVQHGHARAAIEGLEQIYSLETDQPSNGQQPLTPETIEGNYLVQGVQFAYGQNPPAIMVTRLQITKGERIILLGPIGSGKSTLLRLLSGLYQPQTGKVMLDGLDLSHIHRQIVNDHIGYLQQDHRLFLGTLRENLLIGLPDPGDEVLLQNMRRTGMDAYVAGHPMGLQRPIAEGGKGLSGGQKQLLAFTRIIMTQPDVLLLDEPTATMDEQQERRCIEVLKHEASLGRTMVIATHKPSLLSLATRVIVVAHAKIMLDDTPEAVIKKIQSQTA